MTAIHAPRPSLPSTPLRFAGLGLATLAVALLSRVPAGGHPSVAARTTRPGAGHSEHHLGTSIDVTSEGGAAPWDYGDRASTPAGACMAANAWR